jgi:hypothetical protein
MRTILLFLAGFSLGACANAWVTRNEIARAIAIARKAEYQAYRMQSLYLENMHPLTEGSTK